MNEPRDISRLQIVGAAAVLAVAVATLLTLAPALTSNTGADAQVTRSAPFADAMPKMKILEHGTDPTGQVYTLEQPTSGVLVTLGTVRLSPPAGVADAGGGLEPKFITVSKPPLEPVVPRRTAGKQDFDSDDAFIDAALDASQLTRGSVETVD